MTKFNPKGVLFWTALFAVAACLTFHLNQGALIFGALALAILFFA